MQDDARMGALDKKNGLGCTKALSKQDDQLLASGAADNRQGQDDSRMIYRMIGRMIN